MRLRKMDDQATCRNKETANLAPPVEFHYLRNMDNTETVVTTSLPSNSNLLSTQYLNIQRVPELVSASKNFTHLLNTNELIVDSNGDFVATSGLDRYMPQDPQEYESDLIQDELTEDDRRLAAALVAVQLVSKQQTGSQILPLLSNSGIQVNDKMLPAAETTLVNLPPILESDKTVEMPASTSSNLLGPPETSLPSYSQQNPAIHSFQSLKKVSHSKIRYLGQDDTVDPSCIPLESLGIHTEMVPVDMENADMKNHTNLEFMLPDETKDAFETEESDDTDYGPSENSRRHSLPHKKRIPRRLRQPKKTQASNTRNVGARPYQINNITYTCELCYDQFTNQWKFYEHLKTHYEPQQLENRNNSTYQQDRLYSESDSRLRQILQRRQSPAVSSAVTTATPTFRVSPRATLAVRSPTPRLAEQPRTETYETSKTPKKTVTSWSEDIDLQQLDLTASHVLYQCSLCKRVFRRKKAYEVHMATTHNNRTEDVDEFSEPEDMMAGIRVQVASDEDDTFQQLQAPTMQKGWCNEEEIYVTEEDLPADIRNVDIKFQSSTTNTHEPDLTALGVVSEAPPVRFIKLDETVEVDNVPEQLEEQPQPVVFHKVIKVDVKHEEGELREEDLEPEAVRTCRICEEVFTSRAETNEHITTQHADLIKSITSPHRKPEPSKKLHVCCKLCDRKFIHRNSLLYHMKSHSGKRDFLCKVCDKEFFSQSALKVHMRRHTNTKPFKCDFCSRDFRQWGDLKHHIISIHSNVRNYQCDFCGKEFARKYSLTIHRRIHTGEKNYKCEYCDKGFRASSYLVLHRKIHTGEKPYQCDVCGKNFRVRSDMRRHLHIHKDWQKPDEVSSSRDVQQAPQVSTAIG